MKATAIFSLLLLCTLALAFTITNPVQFPAFMPAGDSYDSQLVVQSTGPFNVTFDVLALGNTSPQDFNITEEGQPCNPVNDDWFCPNFTAPGAGTWPDNLTISINPYLQVGENIQTLISYSGWEDVPPAIPLTAPATPTYYSSYDDNGGGEAFGVGIQPQPILNTTPPPQPPAPSAVVPPAAPAPVPSSPATPASQPPTAPAPPLSPSNPLLVAQPAPPAPPPQSGVPMWALVAIVGGALVFAAGIIVIAVRARNQHQPKKPAKRP